MMDNEKKYNDGAKRIDPEAIQNAAEAFVRKVPKSEKKYAEYSEPDMLIAFYEGVKFAFRMNNWPKDLLTALLKDWDRLTRGEKRDIVKRVKNLM